MGESNAVFNLITTVSSDYNTYLNTIDSAQKDPQQVTSVQILTNMWQLLKRRKDANEARKAL